MEGTTGSGGIDKPWDHAWSTEEMRKNRGDWSLAGDSGLLKHLKQFSENLTKKANETQEAINSMTSQLNETAILVDNITNTSLALANTQFIESRVQEDNTEIEQPIENTTKNEIDNEFSATDLLVSVCESIKQGLKIMDEKYEKVEVEASDSEDEDDNAVPSVILRPKDPYQDRPLPYVIGTEKWKSSNKVGLESSSSESEQNDEDEDSASDTDDKNIGNSLNSNVRTNSRIGHRLSSASSESNDYNIESSSIKDTDHNRLHARSQDTLNSDTEPTTPSSILPKTQNINNGPPSFAEELAKRLGNVMPSQKNTIAQNTNEQIINRTKDDIFSPEYEQDVFSNKTDNLFSEGKNLFSDEVSSSSWKNKPVRPVNKTIIPPSIDVPPPLSIISSAPKSNLDDLFGDADDSEDSDDIFSKKSSKDIFAAERQTIRSEIVNKQKNLNIENVQNTSIITTSTPETNDRGKGLFEDEDDDDLFGSASKQIKTPDAPHPGSGKKKPIGGVSILGQVDIRASSKFSRRPSLSSSSSSESVDQPRQQPQRRIDSSSNNNSSDRPEADRDANGSSSLVTGNNSVAAGNATASSTDNNTGSSSGISMRQPSIDNTAGSSLGADFQPLMSSSRLKSEEIYRERVASDSLFASNSKTSNSSNDQSQQQQARAHQQTPAEDVSEHEDVFGPPPLPKASDNLRAKSKVNSLFDDSDSGEDLFASASPSSRSLKSSEPTPSKVATAPASFSKQPAPDQQSKRLSLFDDDDDLFGPPRDAPDVDLFGAAPVKSLAKVTDGLFDSVDEAVGLSAEEKPKVADLFAEKPAPVADGSFAGKGKSEKKPATSDALVAEKVAKEPSLSKEPTKPVLETSKSGARGLFDDDDSDLFSKASKPSAETEKAGSSFTGSSKSLFEDTADSDLFGSSSKNLLDKNIPIEKSSDGLFSNVAESSDLFAKAAEQKPAKKEPVKDLFEDKLTKSKKLSSSIFDDSDDEDLFGGSSLNKKKASSSIFEDDKRMEGEKKPEDTSMRSKQVEKSSIFEDDDDDDLFGDKKKKPTEKKEVASENEKSTEEAKKENNEAEPESKPKTEQDAKPELAPKKAMFAEIRQKLEKHKLLEPEEERSAKPAAESSSVVDGAVSSKREPPKSLKIQLPLPKELSSNGDKHPAVPKKPVVSGKIKNLMGKMGDLKILSPTDTPPLFRKNPSEDKSSNEDEQEPLTADSEASSEPSTPASLPSGGSSPQNSGTNSKARDSPSLKSDNTEAAISFDEPAQVETLATASKSRARIPAKRRPQSRQARHSALRHSGIDFDAIDTATSPNQPNGDTSDAVDRLMPSGRSQETGHNLDNDKSELSASRNTTTNLLSPSTDEEDLFDVPPDLPEDPAVKEDSLFGRAPILSPIETIAKTAKNSESAKKESAERKAGDSRVKRIKKDEKQEDERNKGDEKKKGIEDKNDKIAEPTDPLRDENHDPLKDPSQLFAFVTKTPSPEKNKGLLLSEDDDSLFSSSSKTVEKPLDARPKPTLDLFNDDDDASGNDLFSSSKSKLKKKPLKDTKIDLFDADSPEDDDDSLFGSTTKKKRDTAPASNIVAKAEEKPESKSTKTTTKDIFNDSSDDEDIFAGNKKAIPKKTSKSLFDDEEDDDNGDIFGKPKSLSLKDSKSAAANDRPVVKKAVTRDLKKTAEKIVEDPLSMLQDE